MMKPRSQLQPFLIAGLIVVALTAHPLFVSAEADGGRRKNVLLFGALETNAYQAVGVRVGFLQFKNELRTFSNVATEEDLCSALYFGPSFVGNPQALPLPRIPFALFVNHGEASSIIKAFAKCKELTSVWAHGSRLEARDLKALEAAPSLMSLSLEGVRVIDADKEQLKLDSLRALKLVSSNARLADLASEESARRLTELTLSGRPDEASVTRLKACSSLRLLDLSDCVLTAQQVHDFKPHAKLLRLRLGERSAGAGVLKAFSSDSLLSVDIDKQDLTNADIEAICRLKQLEQLTIRSSTDLKFGVSHILGSLSNLERLVMNTPTIDPKHFKDAAHGRLKALSLRGCVEGDWLTVLAGFPSLTSLGLTGDKRLTTAIHAASGLKGLADLEVISEEIDGNALNFLSKSNLEHVRIFGRPAKGTDFAAVLKCGKLKTLIAPYAGYGEELMAIDARFMETLELNFSPTARISVKSLRSAHSLRSLRLSGARELNDFATTVSSLKNLEVLTIQGHSLSADSIAGIARCKNLAHLEICVERGFGLQGLRPLNELARLQSIRIRTDLSESQLTSLLPKTVLISLNPIK